MAESFGQGNSVPWHTNTERQLESKILLTLAAGGGGGGAGMVGVGSPEGVIVAPAGTTYLDTSNNAFYIKGSGVGSSGWVELIA
jgi:hypothetical protein